MAIITDDLNRAFREARQGMTRDSGRGLAKMAGFERKSSQLSEASLAKASSLSKFGLGGGGGGADVRYTSPEIRNPLLNLVNFYLPYDRRTLNQWIRYYDRFQPMIGNALDMHGEFPMSDFRLIGIEDQEILDFYEEQKERANIVDFCFEASREYDLIGEVFGFWPWNDGDGMWDEYVILNPDLLDIQEVNWGPQRRTVYSYEPPQEFKQLVHNQSDRVQDIIEEIDPMVLEAVMNNERIPLDEKNITGMIRRASPYDARGTSIVLRCLVPGTLVWMADGTRKEIEDVQVGDEVLAGNGKPTKVVMTHVNEGPEEVITLKDCLGGEITTTADHKFKAIKVVRGKSCPHMHSKGQYCQEAKTEGGYTCDPTTCERFGGEVQEVEAGDLNVWDYLVRPIPVVDEKSVDVDPYALGYFVGDGSSMGQWEMNWCGSSSEAGMEVQGRLKQYLEKLGISGRILQQDNYWRLDWCNKELRAKYTELLTGLTCKTKKLSQAVMNMPKDQLEQFIQGWFDADGTTVKEGTERISTANLTLAHQLQFLLLRLGVWSSLQCARNDYEVNIETIARNREGRVIYTVRFRRSGRQRRSFGLFVRDGLLFIRINGVERNSYDGPTLCVTVDDPEHYFVAEGYILSNCIKDLLYEDKLREVQYAIADHHITPVQLWKLGDVASGYMPTDEDINNFRALLMAGAHDPLFTIVSHSAVSLDLIGYTGQLLPVIPEFDWVEQRVLTALYTNKSMTSGEGPAVQAGAVVALKVIQGRYQTKRSKIARLIRRKIYEPLAYEHELYEITEAELSHRIRRSKKDRKLLVPDVEWEFKLDLTDETQRTNFLMQMRQNFDLPVRTLCEILDLDYDKVKEYYKEEEGTVFDPVYRDARKANAQQVAETGGGLGGVGGEIGPMAAPPPPPPEGVGGE